MGDLSKTVNASSTDFSHPVFFSFFLSTVLTVCLFVCFLDHYYLCVNNLAPRELLPEREEVLIYINSNDTGSPPAQTERVWNSSKAFVIHVICAAHVNYKNKHLYALHICTCFFVIATYIFPEHFSSSRKNWSVFFMVSHHFNRELGIWEG